MKSFKTTEEHRARARKWYEENRERALAARKAHYKADPEKAKAYSRARYQAQKPKLTAQVAEWQKANPEKVIAAKRKWRAANPDKQRAASAQWAKAHPEKLVERVERRRARKVNAKGDFTAAQAAARVAYYGGLCAYCRCAPHEELDHVIPLSRGGTNWPANLRPACGPCNLSKGAKSLSEWKPKEPQ